MTGFVRGTLIGRSVSGPAVARTQTSAPAANVTAAAEATSVRTPYVIAMLRILRQPPPSASPRRPLTLCSDRSRFRARSFHAPPIARLPPALLRGDCGDRVPADLADSERAGARWRRGGHLREACCADPAAQLPGVPSRRRRRADGAGHLRRRAAVGESDQDTDGA